MDVNENKINRMTLPRPLVLTATNRKGGCAKSSSIFHLGGAYAQLGYRVLWIDLDPQGSLTQMVYPDEQFDALHVEQGITALFAELPIPRTQLIHPYLPGDKRAEKAAGIKNLAILPATPQLRAWNFPHGGVSFDRQGICHDRLVTVVAQAIKELEEHFDVFLLDTAPSLEGLTLAALLAADGAFTPTAPEDFEVKGLWYAEQFVRQAQERNPRLRWLGVLKTKVQPRLAVHLAYQLDLQKRYGQVQADGHNQLFETMLPLHAVFKEAVMARTPLPFYKPKSAGALAVRALAGEILQRLGYGVSEGKVAA